MITRTKQTAARFELQKKLSDESARSGALAFEAVTAIGMVLETALARSLGVQTWPSITAAFASFVILIVTLFRWRKLDRRMSATFFAICALMGIGAFFITNPSYAALGYRWIPFQGMKLGCLIAAMLAPTYAAGISVISLSAGLVVFQYSMFPPDVRLSLATGEPWVTIGFGMAGIIILWNRLHRLELERNSITTQMELAATQDLGRLVLHLRDSLNTPLQILEFSVDLLRIGNATDEATFMRMKNALGAIERTNAALVRYEKGIAWGAEDLAFNTLSDWTSPGVAADR